MIGALPRARVSLRGIADDAECGFVQANPQGPDTRDIFNQLGVRGEYIDECLDSTRRLMFVKSQFKMHIHDGEIIASRDTAARSAPDYGWSTAEELLLYLIHGALHLTGMDDHDDPGRLAMRNAEDRYLGMAGIQRPARQVATGDEDLP